MKATSVSLITLVCLAMSASLAIAAEHNDKSSDNKGSLLCSLICGDSLLSGISGGLVNNNGKDDNNSDNKSKGQDTDAGDDKTHHGDNGKGDGSNILLDSLRKANMSKDQRLEYEQTHLKELKEKIINKIKFDGHENSNELEKLNFAKQKQDQEKKDEKKQ